jgi:hypothetical protein
LTAGFFHGGVTKTSTINRKGLGGKFLPAFFFSTGGAVSGGDTLELKIFIELRDAH